MLKKFFSKRINVERALILMCAICYPIYAFIYPEEIESFWIRSTITPLALSIVALSFLNKKVEKNFTNLFYILCFLYPLNALYISYINNFSVIFAFGWMYFALLITLVIDNFKVLIGYLVLAMISATLVFFCTANPGIDSSLFLSSNFSVAFFAVVAYSLKYRYMRRLRYQNTLLENIYEYSTDSLILANPQTLEVIDCNRKLLDLIGIKSKSQIIGKRFDLLGDNDYSESDKDGIIALLDSGETFNDERIFVMNRATKNKIWAEVALKKVKIGDEEFYFSRFTDVTLRKKAEQSTKDLLKKVQNSNQMLNSFAHTVAHDLKEPLRNINTFSNIIEHNYKTQLDEKGLELFNHLNKSSLKLASLIDGVLKYSKISYDQKNIKLTDLNIIIDTIRSLIIIPEDFEIIVATDLPQIKVDEVMITQMFQNIITNAIRYNSKDRGEILIQFCDKQNKLVFTDNGNGIPKKHLDKIFDLFHRAESKDEGSTGIGLSIVKRISDIHNWKIEVDSTIDIGTVFTFEIPKKSVKPITSKAKKLLVN